MPTLPGSRLQHCLNRTANLLEISTVKAPMETLYHNHGSSPALSSLPRKENDPQSRQTPLDRKWPAPGARSAWVSDPAVHDRSARVSDPAVRSAWPGRE